MELCTILISKDLLQTLVDSEALSTEDFEVKIIDVKDDFFKDDERHKELSKASHKAYKQLKEYEFNVRHNQRTK
jgi:hypothetical protein